jgi:predicted transcriptional regulator
VLEQLADHVGVAAAALSHYERVDRPVDRLVRRRDFRRAVVRIARELERVELLRADDLRTLIEPSEAVAA